MELPYHVVDVFTKVPLEGNALAVFPDASALDTQTMQRIAKELNLSETTFVLPRESSAEAVRVRIFTPSAEMEFAGHPTIGTAYVLRRLGIVSPQTSAFALAENVGRVAVRVDGASDDAAIWLTTPPIRECGTVSPEACARALSLGSEDLLPVPCAILSAGNPQIFVPVKDPAAVDRAVVESSGLAALLRASDPRACLFVFAPAPAGAYSRMFAPHLGVAEDPATGSATGPLAAFMMKHALAPNGDGTRFVSEQGTKMGRRSLLHILIHGPNGCDGIEIGGYVTYLASASMTLR